MFQIWRPTWIVLVVACAAPPKPVEPIGGKTVAPQVVRPSPAKPPPITGHERVQFEANTAAIAASQAAVLDAVVKRLNAEPTLDLELSGHTDPAEHDADNTGPTGLSHARADAVRRYLVGRGILGTRLVIRAVGTAEPHGTSNRRVELEQVTIKVDPFGGRMVVTSTDVEILDVVSFEPGKDVIMPTSFPILDAVAATLLGNPGIQLVEVQGHTDERGDAAVNLRLSEARAVAVVSYLIGKGVDRARLVAQGYGETQPLDTAHTEAAWAKNQRIAFLILKRAP